MKHRIIIYVVIFSVLFLLILQVYQPKSAQTVSPRPRFGGNYLISTPQCFIPDISPMDPLIAKFRKYPPPKAVCSSKLPLSSQNGLQLVFHWDRLSTYKVQRDSVSCSYQGIQRITQKQSKYNKQCDSQYKLKKSVPITHSLTNITEDGIMVTCKRKSSEKKSKPLYQSLHMFVQPKHSEEKRKTFMRSGGWEKAADTYSILILGIDSVSRLNLQRHMPKTFSFLTNVMKALDFKVFNKIADNTHPNLIATLTGFTRAELNAACHKKRYIKFDDCPFIWKEYAKKGHVTLFVEDAPRLGAFTYRESGFLVQPTDYYVRPYILAADKMIIHSGTIKKSSMCYGPKRTNSFVYEFLLDSVHSLKDVPYFGLFWTGSITHNNLNSAAVIDEETTNLLEKLHFSNALNHTILFYLSDHGMRWGPIRSTYVGMLEERLPYMFIVVPESFKKRHPQAWKNMKVNKDRLVTPFDNYQTLQNILHLGEDNSSSVPFSTYGQTLFKEIPLNRSCSDADIPEHFCACVSNQKMDVKNSLIKSVSEYVVSFLNTGLRQYPMCSQLKLDKISDARKKYLKNPKLAQFKTNKTDLPVFTVTFSTLPSNALFEATVLNHNNVYEVSGEVSRINKYGDESFCISDVVYQKYCYCNSLKNSTATT